MPSQPFRQYARLGASMLVVVAWTAALTAAQPNLQIARQKDRIEREFGRPLDDVVRLRLWSRYGMSNRFATDLGLTRKQLDELFETRRWELMDPPSLAFQNRAHPQVSVRAATLDTHRVDGFVDQTGQAARLGTQAVISCGRNTLTVSFSCDAGDPKSLVAENPARDSRPPKEGAYWDGDLVPLSKMLYKGMTLKEELEWVKKLPPPSTSVLLDDCLVISLTPTVIGKVQSHRDLAFVARDPQEILAELEPLEDPKVFLEGAFYFLAINPNGAVLDVFYDPWGGGVFCPAWHSEAKISTNIAAGTWETKVEIPLKSLQPKVNENSVWGVDLCRIDRSGNRSAIVTRSEKPIFVKYDLAVPEKALPVLPPRPAVSVEPASQPLIDGPFPTDDDWSRAKRIKGLLTNKSGRTSERTQVSLLHDERRLFIRFDCQEQDISRLKVVSREKEEQAYGKGNRRANFLDRREAWGLDWGDYVEVLLAPERDSADAFHSGLFQILVNSRGDALKRYYDTFGMFTVSPVPPWGSGTRTHVSRDGNIWSVEIAIEFDSLCSSATASTEWGLNLHRCISADNASHIDAAWLWGESSDRKATRGQEIDLCWSPTGGVIRNVQRLGAMNIDPRKVKLARSTRPASAPGRIDGLKQRPLMRSRESDRLASVCFVDAEHGWAVGGLGTILHTADGGSTWNEQVSGTNFILESVVFVDPLHGWAVGGWPRDYEVSLYGGMGVILATDDGGKTWRHQLEAAAGWLSNAYFIDSSHGWAVGEYGTVLRTQDGGETWTQMRNVPTPAWIRSVHFVDEQHGWAVGTYETVLKTDDGGKSWVAQKMPSPRRLHGLPIAYESVRFANATEGYVVGQYGNILRTADGGRTWTFEAIDATRLALDLVNLCDLTTTYSGKAWAVSPVGVLARTTDQNGAMWRLVKTGTPAWLRCVSFVNDSNGWVAGDRNTVIRTTDGGKTWTKQRDSGRKMGLFYATAHDHHINGSAMASLNEEFDNAYVLLGRRLGPFLFGGSVDSYKNDAATMAMGVPVTYNFNEFAWRGRDNPHRIAERYQHFGGIEPMERRLVAMIRMLRPEILVGEQPVIQEGYYAHGVGDIARALVAAFDSAGDPNRFPELRAFGLEPFTPKKLYLATMWPNEMYPIFSPTLRLAPDHKFSPRLGMTHGEATLMGRQMFWGLLDRGKPPESQKPWPGRWTLHLKESRVEISNPEQDIFDGIR